MGSMGSCGAGRATAVDVALGSGQSRALVHGGSIHTWRKEGALQLGPELLLQHELARGGGCICLDQLRVLAVSYLDKVSEGRRVDAPLAAELLGGSRWLAQGSPSELRLVAIANERQGR
jgi:hypothetical protein